ncbi:hypothetical protein MJO29_001441 [Puccinia striiformis f. sp. tritici]|nr:hypothetical protein MJO29_001441 [Puccinia striiformis f. sp. tritici]
MRLRRPSPLPPRSSPEKKEMMLVIIIILPANPSCLPSPLCKSNGRPLQPCVWFTREFLDFSSNLPLDGLGQIVLLSNNWKISSTTDNHKQLAKSNRHCLIHEISIGSQADNESNSALNWLLSLNRHRKGRSKAYLDSTVEHKLVWLEGATVANGLLVDVHIRTATSYQHNQFTPHLHQNLTWTPVTLFSFRLSTALVQLSAPPSQTPTASQSDKLYHQFCHTAARVKCAQVEGFSAGIGINHRLEDKLAHSTKFSDLLIPDEKI